MAVPTTFRKWWGLGLAVLLGGPAHAQPAYSGPPATAWMQKAQKLQASGDRAGAAAAYAQAYAAYTSVDDSDGMKAALAGKAAAGAGAPAAPAPGPAPVAGHLEGNKPVGLFFVTKSVLGNFRTLSYYFSPEGVAYENPVGLSPAELAATPEKSKGRYTVAGKALSIAWTGYPQPETAAMNRLGGGFSWSGGSIFSAVGPFKGPGQLLGTFEGGTSTYASAVGQSVVSSTLTFRADGTYTSSGVATVTTATARGVAETGGSSQQAGHWKLDGWYLTLTDAQGHTARDVAYPVGTDAKVTLFQFNGMAYERK
ncbi:hypothetical protein ACFQ48_12945 [Hymenobacter caeli]|uniref:hypothetical protein n=1 Tax=Hymenobacter caeli TaxID=2735894 RepID=UPI003626E8D9